MEIASALIDFILHVDVHLANFVQAYGFWVYALLFAIIFAETGLVVMPFLPGDSLLFVDDNGLWQLNGATRGVSMAVGVNQVGLRFYVCCFITLTRSTRRTGPRTGS